MDRKDKRIFAGIFVLLAAVFLVFLPGCPWRNALGFPCPGCGMTRAWLCFARLDLAGALRQHPMFWAVPVFFWLFWRDFRPFRSKWVNLFLILALTAGLLGCYGFRMYFGLIE